MKGIHIFYIYLYFYYGINFYIYFLLIKALADGQSHVPYRDAKLTRVLEESLGGNSKTALIICCAPEERHASETVSTLRFGERAKLIKVGTYGWMDNLVSAY